MSRSPEDIVRDALLAEAELLAQLTQHPGWAKFEALLTDMRQSALEQLAVASPDKVPVWQGMAATLAEIKNRPNEIVATARTILDEEAQRRGGERTALDFADGISTEDDL